MAEKKFELSKSQKDFINWRNGKLYVGDQHIKGPYMTLDSGQTVQNYGRDNYYSQFGFGDPREKDNPNAWLDPKTISYLASWTYNTQGQHPEGGSAYAYKRYQDLIKNFEEHGHVIGPRNDWDSGNRRWKENVPWDQHSEADITRRMHGDYSKQRQWATDRAGFEPPKVDTPPPQHPPQQQHPHPIETGPTQGTEAPVQGLTPADLNTTWDQQPQVDPLQTQYQDQIADLTSTWDAEKAGLEQQIGGLNTTLGEATSSIQDYQQQVKQFEEMQIQNAERQRLQALYGKPPVPLVHGVKTQQKLTEPAAKWRTPKGQFNRTGMRITNLNI